MMSFVWQFERLDESVGLLCSLAYDVGLHGRLRRPRQRICPLHPFTARPTAFDGSETAAAAVPVSTTTVSILDIFEKDSQCSSF